MTDKLPYVGWVPTPEEIAAECEKIREEWGPQVRAAREPAGHWEVPESRCKMDESQ